jgi:hypothetical protein
MITLKPGDIVLVHGSSFSARLIQFATRSRWNHAALVARHEEDGDYTIYESDKDGVVASDLSRYGNSDIAIYRMPDLNNSERNSIVKAARETWGNQYDYPIVIWTVKVLGWKRSGILLAKIVFGLPWRAPHIQDKYLVCSEMVQEAYSSAGFPLTDDEYLVTPGDIAKCEKLERVY